MEALVIAMVLLAAALHAGWNRMVKIRGERMLVMAMITGWSGICSAVLLPFVQVPTADVWPYIAASLVLHNLYYLFLISAYRHGDLSHVYPIARGSAPLFVAILSVFVLGEEIDQRGMIAIGLIAGGLMSLALTRGVGGLRDTKAILYALGTGAFVALYTIVDGTGARLAGPPDHGIERVDKTLGLLGHVRVRSWGGGTPVGGEGLVKARALSTSARRSRPPRPQVLGKKQALGKKNAPRGPGGKSFLRETVCYAYSRLGTGCERLGNPLAKRRCGV